MSCVCLCQRCVWRYKSSRRLLRALVADVVLVCVVNCATSTVCDAASVVSTLTCGSVAGLPLTSRCLVTVVKWHRATTIHDVGQPCPRCWRHCCRSSLDSHLTSPTRPTPSSWRTSYRTCIAIHLTPNKCFSINSHRCVQVPSKTLLFRTLDG